MKKLKKIFGLFLFASCILSAVTLLTFSEAAATSLQDLYNQKKNAAAQKQAAAAAAAQKAKEAAVVQAQIESTAAKINAAESALTTTEKQITGTEANIADLNEKIKIEEIKLNQEKEKANQIISSWYMQGEEGLLTAVISSDSLSEVVTKQEQYSSIQQQIEDTMNRIEIYKNQLTSQKNAKDQKLISLQDLEKSQENQKSELVYQKNMKSRLYSDTQKAIAEFTAQEKEAAKQEQNALNEIARIAASRPRGLGQKVNAGDVIGSMGTSGNSTGVHLHFEVRTSSNTVVNPRNYLGSMFIWPTVSYRITQEFGWTDWAASGFYGGSPHSGLDIGASNPGAAGDPIFAAGAGEILLRQWYGAYGNAAIIGHDNGMMTLYAHMAN